MTHPKTNQTIPHPLLTDLLDQALTLPEVARRHDRALDELAAILESPRFAAAAAAFAEAVARRAEALRPVVRAGALAAVCRVMNQEITSAARAESVRKAVGMVLRWKDAEPEDHDANGRPVPEDRRPASVTAPKKASAERPAPLAASPAGRAAAAPRGASPASRLRSAAGKGRSAQDPPVGTHGWMSEGSDASLNAREPVGVG